MEIGGQVLHGLTVLSVHPPGLVILSLQLCHYCWVGSYIIHPLRVGGLHTWILQGLNEVTQSSLIIQIRLGVNSLVELPPERQPVLCFPTESRYCQWGYLEVGLEGVLMVSDGLDIWHNFLCCLGLNQVGFLHACCCSVSEGKFISYGREQQFLLDLTKTTSRATEWFLSGAALKELFSPPTAISRA